MNLFGKNGPNMFDEIDGEFAGDADAAGGPKTRFKEEEDKVDLLKGIRDQKKIIIPKIVKGKEKKAEGQATEGDSDAAATPGETPAATPEGETPGGPTAEEKAEDEKFMEEDTGSVASSTKSLAKHLRMLRNALYENYLPPSINNLKINAKIVFAALLIITIVWYVYSKSIYS